MDEALRQDIVGGVVGDLMEGNVTGEGPGDQIGLQLCKSLGTSVRVWILAQASGELLEVPK